MIFNDVLVVRVYITEQSGLLKPILNYLQKQSGLHGVSVFRAISGFGDNHELHASGFMDLSLNLPLVIEFFDQESTITPVLDHLNSIIKPDHILVWKAQVNQPL